MQRKKLLKSIAFICGLYFVLEFVLPEKIGGGFDSYRIGAGDVVRRLDGSFELLYTGFYRADQAALGAATAVDGRKWSRTGNGPILQRGLFTGWDQRGLLNPRVAGDLLLYHGADPEQNVTVCAASRTDAGWEKRGPVSLEWDAGHRPEPDVAPIPACLSIVADENRWVGWFAFTRPDGATPMFRGVSNDGIAWHLDPVSVLPGTDPGRALRQWRSVDLSPRVPDTNGRPYGGPVAVALGADDLVYRIDRTANDDDGPFHVRPVALPDHAGLPTSVSVLPAADGTARIWWSFQREPAADAPPRMPEIDPHETNIATGRLLDDAVVSLPADDADHADDGLPPAPSARPTYLSRGTESAGQFLQIVSAFALGLAVVNLVIFHGRTIRRRAPGRTNSVAFFLFFILMALFAWKGQPVNATGTWKVGFDFLFNNIQFAMGAAVFSTVAFYMVSAAYRAFKVKSGEAALMMLAAMIVMIGQVPLGRAIANLLPPWLQWLGPPAVSEEILTVVTAAAYRGVLIGTIIGAIAMSLRVWLGLEESIYEGTDK